jgi:hypothetical protein
MRAFLPVLMLLTAASTPDQFDLNCKAWVRGTGNITRHYRVDLATKQWCVDACTVKPLAEVNNTQIVFVDTKAQYRGDPSEALDFVDRTSGKWAFYAPFWMGQGTCEPAPFSGFPTPDRRF